MQHIVINLKFGGFSLSPEADKRMLELGYVPNEDDMCDDDRDYAPHGFYSDNVERDNPILVQVVRELGQKASGDCARLGIAEVPDGVEWDIHEYDGNEHVEEVHRIWRAVPAQGEQ